MPTRYSVYMRGDANGVISPVAGPRGGYAKRARARSVAQVDSILRSAGPRGELGPWVSPGRAQSSGLVLPLGNLRLALIEVAATPDRGLTYYICVHNPSASQETP